MSIDLVLSKCTLETSVDTAFEKHSIKDFFRDCLMKTEICRKISEREKFFDSDPALVMDCRHRMDKQISTFYPVSQTQIHSEALKLLRIESDNKLKKHNETKIVEKEIAKLKNGWEIYRLLTKKEIEEATYRRTKSAISNANFKRTEPKLSKTFEHCALKPEINNPSIEKCNSFKSKMHSNDVSSTAGSTEKSFECNSTKKGTVVESENDSEKSFVEEIIGKHEIMRRFIENDIKEKMKYKETNIITDPKVRHCEKKQITEKLENESLTLKSQPMKNRQQEKLKYKSKIEAFLTKLYEKKNKNKNTRTSCLVQKKTMDLISERKVEMTEKLLQYEEKEEKLKKLILDIKTSQLETSQKLREKANTDLKNKEIQLNSKFFKRMEKRREERVKRRNEIEQKRKNLEEERQRAKVQEEETKKREEKELKRRKRNEIKEKRKLDDEKRLKQKQREEKDRLNQSIAENHYKRYLIRSYGFRPWMVLMESIQIQTQLAVSFYEKNLFQKTFRNWFGETQKTVMSKKKRADDFYKSKLKEKYLCCWINFHKENVKQEQVSADWYDFKIIERAFRQWLEFTRDEYIIWIEKYYAADDYYKRKLKLKTLNKLRQYPELKKIETERENRKQKWRERVKEILPDYEPVDSNKHFMW